MQRRKNRRSRKSVAPLHKSVRRSAIELLESKHLLTSFGYLQVPLAADQAGAALLQDPNLQNAWGVSISPGGGPVWVADNAANVASRYSGAVTGSSFTSAASVGVPDNSPTAIVFNQTTDFTVGTGSNAFTPIFFIASANGKIDAWSTGNQAQNAVSVSGAEFTGLAVANNGTASFLYAADFHNGQIDVFDSHFNQTTLSATAFTDTALTAQGFAPYNIQLIGGQLYVTYAKQDASKQNPVPATGNGAIDVFSLNGTLVKQLVSGSELNVPYGLAVAPASFGDAAGDLLVANSGSGQILAYNISGATATFAGTLNSANSTPINIPGVRGLVFGNDSSAGNDTTLFYSAASGGHGQFGELLNAFQQPLVVVPTNVSANQGQAFSGTLAAVSDSNSSLTAGSFTVTINWGDNLTSSGSVTSNTDGGFNISGTHTYATVGNKKVTITVSDSTTSIVATGTATVTDTSFNPSGTSFAATEGQSFNGLVGSFADPSGPGSYVANINWGDGTSSSATTVSSGLSGGFNVTGTHTYTSVGSFSVSAVISEVSGTTTTAIGTIDSTATVSDPNTLTATAGAFTATQGLSTTATVATFTDSNSAATASLFSATINWGDGTTASAGSVTRGGDGVFTVSGSHAYVENGTLTATVTVSDTPGTATATTTSVADVADGNTFTPHPMTIASNAGQTFAGNVATFSDTNTLVRAADFTATINWGDSTTSTGTITAANGVLTVSGSHSYTSGGTLEPVSVIITENSPGTANATATSTAVVAAGNFTATGATITATASSASSPQTLASFTPDAADQSDTFTATIDWGDGTSFTVGTVTSSGGSSFNVVGSHIYSTPGNYSPQVVVYEASGTATATPAEVITAKANVTSPVVLSPATITAKDHVSSTLTVATFTDADASVTATDFTATINWGDGTSASLGTVTLNNGVFTVAGIHTFAEAGTLDVSVTVTQDAPTVFSTSATATATVSQDDGFTASAASLSATVGSAFSGVLATFTDTDLQTTASQLTAVIHWGDGSDTAGTVTGSSGQFAVHGSHTYTQDGSFPLSVTIENSSSLPGFTEAVATGSAMVSPGSAFTATGTTITPSEGQTFSGTVATFTDTGSSNPQSAFTATIKWGDGSTTSGTVTGSSGSYTVSGSHAYSDGGSYQMTVQVVETAISDTISAVSTATVSGSDTLTASNSTFTATAGTSFTGAVAGFTDSNTAAVAGDFTATISWGDGSTSTTGTVTGSNGVFTITGQHLYSTAATDTVKVTIKDVHLSSVSATATSTADVLAATGTGATTGTISGLVFDDLNLNGVFEAGDPGLAGRTVFLNVDGSGKADGTNPQATTDANGNFTFTGLQPGTYQVMEVISANGGQTLTTSPQTVTLTTGQTVTGVNIGNLVTSKIVPLPVTTSGPQAASDVNTAYINALYQSILGHAPDATGLAFWQQQMAAGASRATVAQGIWDSPEHRKQEVDGFYQEFLNRAPDAQGEQFWINAFNSWGTEQLEVVGFLTATSEYASLHPGNTAFVDALYNDIDQRPADSAGEANWVTQLGNGATPVQVALDFVFGQEASTHIVNGFYSAFLHRAPDAASLQMWVNDLDAQTMTAEQVAIQLLASNEYFTRVTASQAPAITSAASTTFTAGTASTFHVTTSGVPAPSITATGLPSGVTLTDNHDGTATLASTTAAAANTYTFTITASNGIGTAATQNFTLTISPAQTQSAPAFTSANSSVFTAGSAGSFSITSSGSPAATITENGTLPSGLTFTPGTGGTATITGTPAANTGGTYTIALTASNGVGTAATQSLLLIVNQAPSITSTASTSFVAGTVGTFKVQTAGFPVTSISATGLPNAGLTLVDNHDGTATLTSTTGLAAGSYPLTINATNNIGTPASQSFTLTVAAASAAPAFTSATSTTFTTGTASTFSVTTTGSPSATLTESGTLPTGVTFVDHGGGQGTLSGTAAANTGGTYNFTITADNGNGTPVAQNFTLTVHQAPAFTSAASATFVAGTAGTFKVQTSGFPTASVSGTGLPANLTLTPNSDGTATLTSGTSLAAGTYPFTLQAANGVGTQVTQSFTLTVAAAASAPAFTSAGNATFTVGTAGTFSVTTSGAPSAALTESGTLPAGVTFVDNGGGRGTLSGTPAAGTGGTYSFTLTANNGNGTPGTQTFVLTVDQAPAITSANATTFVAGASGTFTVHTAGFPNATINVTGLPSGVTRTDNGNGTATITSTTGAAAGTYSLTITATNGVGTTATQSFTLTIGSTQTAPAFTSATSATFVAGTGGTFSVTTTGTPSAALSLSGQPQGVTLVDNGGGQGKLTVASSTAAGVYNLTFSATNGVGNPITQSFTLTVNAPLSFTSASSASFVSGTGGTFTVSATGTPTATITETGTPPTGVSLGTSSNGSATLTVGSTTPAGVYTLTFSASNGVGNPVTQSFTLTVGTAPSFSSATSVSFVAGTGGTFTVSASGTPTASITETDTPPTGVSLGTSSNGSATLTVGSTTPAGVYHLTFSATNGVGNPVTQSFTLTVGTAPAFTGATSATFAPGAGGTATISTTGSPNATVSEDPNDTPITGVTLTPNADGTATLTVGTSTPAGVYTLNLIASNGVGTAATEQFKLTVGTAPAFTGATSATFAPGAGGTATISTTGSPNATVSEDPNDTPISGVTLTPNADGTATLTVGTSTPAGVYTLNLIASNNVGTAATEQFKLTVGTAPAFTGATSATFAPGAGGTATISTTGSPNATVSEDPNDTPISGVTLTPNADGTATLTVGTSTPAGVHTLNLIATNGVGTAATEQFTLTVGTAPAFSSNSGTSFAAGTGGTFTITTTGSPTPTISEDPNDTPVTGVSLTPNGDGTATLTVDASTPAGVYTLNLIASNNVGTAATQQFTLTIS